MNEDIRTLMSELKSGLEAIYGDRLRGIYLYGSYARGEEDPGSDVDVLVVLDQCADYGSEIDRTSYLVSDLSMKWGISISRVFVPEQEWLFRDAPFLLNAREEAIPA